MARVPRKLTVHFTADSRRDLDEIWDWNAKTRGVRQVQSYVKFLRAETRKLRRFANPGREVPSNPTLRYQTIKRRAGGYGHVVIFWIEAGTLHILRFFTPLKTGNRRLRSGPIQKK